MSTSSDQNEFQINAVTGPSTPINKVVAGPLSGDKVVSGRKVWMQALDRVMAQPVNVQKFAADIQAMIDVNSVEVFKQFSMPFLIKEAEQAEPEVKSISIRLVPKTSAQPGTNVVSNELGQVDPETQV